MKTKDLKQLFELQLPLEDFTFELYLLWCESVTINTREFQQVLANNAVANWFRYELAKNELEYQFLIQNYTTASISDRAELYLKCIFGIFSRFPKPLLDAAKQRTLKGSTTKVSGIPIEFSIINQN